MAWVLDGAWKRLNDTLLALVGPERYSLWIRHVRPALFDEEVFAFHLPDASLRDKIERLFKVPATEAARRAANRNVRVRFEAERAAFPEGGRPAPDPPPSFESFVAGPGNRMALAAARAFVEGFPSARSLLLLAPSGLGKSHILGAIASELAPRVALLHLSGEQFRRHFDYAFHRGHAEAFLNKCRSVQAFLIDGLEPLSGRPEAQAALADVLAGLESRRCRAVLASERHPRQIDGLLPALLKRLRFQIEATIDRPDAATGTSFLAARAPRGTPRSVLEYIAAHVRSSHRDQLECLARVLDLGAPSASAARAVVGEFLNQWSRGLTYADIVRAAAETFGVSVGEIYSGARSRGATDARQACYYLARRLLKHPFARIGEHFGGRDHATVIEACRKLTRRRGALHERLKRLEETLRTENP